MMASDLAAIATFSENGTEEIEIPTAIPGPSNWTSRSFRLNNAHSKILALVLAYETPRDLLTGQVVDTDKALAWQNAKEFHHIFPQAFLKARGVSAPKASSLANMLYLTSASNKTISDQAPSAYLKQLLDEHGENAKQWLSSNLIDEPAINAALNDDYDAFLDARAKTIDAHTRKLAGWDVEGN